MPKARRTTKAGLKAKKKNFVKFLAVFEEETELHAFKCNKEIAREYAKEAREKIESQGYNWAPLSPRYLERKLEQGYDPRIYIRTGEFLDSISWGVTQGKVWTGIPARKMHTGRMARADERKRKPVQLRWLARWLEFGVIQKRTSPSGRTYLIILPPRPIWRPLLSKFVRNRKDFAKRYRKALNKAVKRRTRAGIK